MKIHHKRKAGGPGKLRPMFSRLLSMFRGIKVYPALGVVQGAGQVIFVILIGAHTFEKELAELGGVIVVQLPMFNQGEQGRPAFL